MSPAVRQGSRAECFSCTLKWFFLCSWAIESTQSPSVLFLPLQFAALGVPFMIMLCLHLAEAVQAALTPLQGELLYKIGVDLLCP